MVASQLFILDVKGKVLIKREYRGDVPSSAIERFMPVLLEQEEDGIHTPIITIDLVNFTYIKHNNLYIVATSSKNANVTLLFAFIHKAVAVFTGYFTKLEEESIRDNFVIIYELLDEIMDYGYPQTTEPMILKEFITQGAARLESSGSKAAPAAVTNAVSWRSDSIVHRRNEVFLDVIESINFLVGHNGNVLQSEIVGELEMRVYLSGMPELRLGLNDKMSFSTSSTRKTIDMEDVKFHQCVRLSRFEDDRTICFVPPDGQFTLMSYRLNTQVKPLITVQSIIEKHSRSRIEFMIKLKSNFKSKSTANNVEVMIPVPADVDSPKLKTSVGSVKYAPERNAMIWTIKFLPGGKEHILRAHFGLPSMIAEEKGESPPINVKFEIPYFTTSGIHVRYMKILEKSGYQAQPYVRYITQSGDYNVRV